MTMQPILVKLSQVEGKMDDSFISTTLLSGVKPFFSAACDQNACIFSCRNSQDHYIIFLPDEENEGKVPRIEADVFKYATPAAVYFINNNLVFMILENVDSTTFQILSRCGAVQRNTIVCMSTQLQCW